MVASSGRVAARAWWDISFFLAQTRLAPSGQVHHVRQREDARLHWKWDHETIDVTRVTLHFHPMPNRGTKLTLLYEGYSKNSEAKKTRDEHIEGWTFFLRKLQEQGQEPKPPLGQRACRTTVNGATTVI